MTCYKGSKIINVDRTSGSPSIINQFNNQFTPYTPQNPLMWLKNGDFIKYPQNSSAQVTVVQNSNTVAIITNDIFLIAGRVIRFTGQTDEFVITSNDGVTIVFNNPIPYTSGVYDIDFVKAIQWSDSSSYNRNVENNLALAPYLHYSTTTSKYGVSSSANTFFENTTRIGTSFVNLEVFIVYNETPFAGSGSSTLYTSSSVLGFITLDGHQNNNGVFTIFNSSNSEFVFSNYLLTTNNLVIGEWKVIQPNAIPPAVTSALSVYTTVNGNNYNSNSISITQEINNDTEIIMPYFDGEIYEIVVMSPTSSSEKAKIEGYLAWKFNLTSNLPNTHPYKNVAPTM